MRTSCVVASLPPQRPSATATLSCLSVRPQEGSARIRSFFTTIYGSKGSGHKGGHTSSIALIYLCFRRPYSPLRRECRSASAEPVCSCAPPSTHCTRDRGCSAHPAFPAPSLGENLGQSSGRSCREIAEPYPCQTSSEEPRSGVSKDESRGRARWFETPAARAPHHERGGCLVKRC
jgi:hypothetical protein